MSQFYIKKEEILENLELVNEELKKLDMHGEILIAGGASMCLAFSARSATKDIDGVYEPKTLKVSGAELPQAMVRSRMYNLHGTIIAEALDKIRKRTQNTEKIVNSTKYLIATIYNEINEFHSDIVVNPELNRRFGY